MIPQNIERQCIKWVHRLQGLVSINIPNCYKPLKLEDIKDCSIHCFSDADSDAFLDTSGNIHCTLIIGKFGEAPIKYVSIPRLELTAATL